MYTVCSLRFVPGPRETILMLMVWVLFNRKAQFEVIPFSIGSEKGENRAWSNELE